MARRLMYESLDDKEGSWFLPRLAAVSVCVGVILGLVASAVTPSSQKFASTQTALRPVVQAAVAMRPSTGSYMPLNAAMENRINVDAQDEGVVVAKQSTGQSSLNWKSLLFPVAALGGLLAWYKTSKRSATKTLDIEASEGWAMAAGASQRGALDPLRLADSRSAETEWAMMAATAFIGTKAPDFEATAVFDEEFVDIKLSQYRGKKYVVLFFYPLDFTFVCPTEITAFSDREAEFSAINTQVIGVSVDSQFSHLAWIQTPRNEGGLGDITYPLVADLKKEIAEAYGVLTSDGVALRGLFIIDKEGVIQHATINNLAFGRSVDETLRVLQAVQHVQANPDEVCPAGWKKGDKTMKPDPEGSKEYFKAI